MKHSEGFLRLVSDAKSRVKEIDIEGYRKLRTSGASSRTSAMRRMVVE